MTGHLGAVTPGKMPSSAAIAGNISPPVHSGVSGRGSGVVPMPALGGAEVSAFGPSLGFAVSIGLYGSGDWLDGALDVLSKIDDESTGEGFPLCSGQAKINAEAILRNLAAITGVVPSVYPTSDREIAIQFRLARGASSVLLLCDSSGSGACFSYVDGKSQRARSDDALDLLDRLARGPLLRINELQR